MMMESEVKVDQPLEQISQDIPEGHTEESGYCFRDALNRAGYNVELPPWVHIDDVPKVCNQLDLNYITGQGERIPIKKDKPLIVGHIVQRRSEGEKRIGHWSFFENPEKALLQLESKDIFAIIPIL